MPLIIQLQDGTVPVAADFMTSLNNLTAAIGTGTTIATYTIGDIVYASGPNTLSKLPAGAVGTVLTQGATIPAWSTPAQGQAPAGAPAICSSNS